MNSMSFVADHRALEIDVSEFFRLGNWGENWIQWAYYCNLCELSLSVGGVFKQLLPEEESFSRALYTFDIGQNDLTSGYFANMTVDQVREYIPEVLDQFSNIVKVCHFDLHPIFTPF